MHGFPNSLTENSLSAFVLPAKMEIPSKLAKQTAKIAKNLGELANKIQK